MKYETKDNLKTAGCGITLATIAFGGIGGCVALLNSCDEYRWKNNIEERVSKSQEIIVEPLSIEYQQSARGSNEGFSMIAKYNDGKSIICRPDTYLPRLRDLSAIVQAEINDGDHETIKLRGYQSNGVFTVTYSESGDFKIGVSQWMEGR